VERQVGFADCELMRQGLRLEPLLQVISDFLDDQKDMIEQVRCDLTRGFEEGRDWSQRLDAAADPALAGSHAHQELGLSRIARADCRWMHTALVHGLLPAGTANGAFHRGFNRLTPETLKAIDDLVVQTAVDLGLENGRKLRVDATVVQTDIHHPTDNTLSWDVVRVVTHLIGRLSAALERRAYQGVPRSDAIGTASDARDPTDDHKAAPGAADRDIPRAHRPRRGQRD
jgi:IS5 family transposase